MIRLLILLLALASSSLAQPIPIGDSFPPTALDGQWKMQPGDDARWADPAFDDSAWRTVRMPASVNAHLGWRWYRLRVQVPQTGKRLAWLIAPLGPVYAFEAFAHGRRIGSFGGFNRNEVRLPEVAAFELPADLPPVTVLALRVRSIPFGIVLLEDASSRIGEPVAIETAARLWRNDRLLRRLPALLTSAAIAAAALFFLTVPLVRRGAMEYFWFGLFLLSSLGQRFLPLYPESLSIRTASELAIATNLVLVGVIGAFGFMLWELFSSRHTVLGWAAALLTWLGTGAPTALPQILGGVLPLEALQIATLAGLFFWFVSYYEFAWRQSTVRGQLLAMHAVLLFHMSGSLFQSLARRYLNLTDAQNLDIQFIRLLTLLAVGIAMAILMNQRSARLERERQRLGSELASASEVQSLLLSAATGNGAYAIEPVYLPASEVGGDFYQILDRDDGSQLVLVGDVSGKGLKAAMLVSVAVGAVAGTRISSPARVLAVMNQALHGRVGSGFVTCCCVRLAPSGEATVANAGHLPPYRSGEPVEVECGLPLGLIPEVDYIETTVALPPGAPLTLLSDGVVEAANAQGELFGFDRTREISTKSAQEIAKTAQTWGQTDDITVATIRRSA